MNVQLFGKYLYLYVSIFMIFASVKMLRKKHGDDFKKLFFSILPKIGIVNLFIYWMIASPLKDMFFFANRNNYAVSLAAIFPYYFIKGMEKKRYLWVCIVIILSLALIGSKSATVGIGMEILLIMAMKVLRQIRNARNIGILFLAIVFCTGIMVMQTSLKIHGHSMANIYSEMKSHILSGTMYQHDNSSLTFRTNAIICMMNSIWESRFIGIGIGNSGRYILNALPGDFAQRYVTKYGKMPEVLSPHNSLLEFCSDCGLWAIILIICIFKNAVKKFINPKNNDFVDTFYVSFVLSFPIWSMSASGIYTIYYLFILVACFYEWYQIKGEGNIINRPKSQIHRLG